MAKTARVMDSDITLYDEQVKVSKTNLDTAREQLNAKRGRLETLSSQVKEETKILICGIRTIQSHYKPFL